MSAVHYALDAGAARLTLSAADRGNPLDPGTAAELHEAVRRARADDARVVVLRSEGRAFSVGGDVGAFAAAADDRERLVDDLAETLHRTISDLHRMDAVVVSVVQGVAAGAGVPLAALCPGPMVRSAARPCPSGPAPHPRTGGRASTRSSPSDRRLFPAPRGEFTAASRSAVVVEALLLFAGR